MNSGSIVHIDSTKSTVLAGFNIRHKQIENLKSVQQQWNDWWQKNKDRIKSMEQK